MKLGLLIANLEELRNEHGADFDIGGIVTTNLIDSLAHRSISLIPIVESAMKGVQVIPPLCPNCLNLHL